MSLLLLAALLSVGLYEPPAKHEGGTLTAVNLSAAAGEKSDNPAPKQQKAAQQAAQATATAPAAAKPPRVVVPTDNKVVWPEGFIPMSRSDFAAADISKIKGQSGTGSGAQQASAGAAVAASVEPRPMARASTMPNGIANRATPPSMAICGQARIRGDGRKSPAAPLLIIMSTVAKNWMKARVDRAWPACCARPPGNFWCVRRA
jgi:hypothetical protein